MLVNKHHFIGGHVYLKEFELADGEIITQHKHTFDHVTLLASGSVIVTLDGAPSLHHAPDYLFIKAEKHHQMQAFDGPALLYCTHITDCTDPDSIDHTLIMDGDHA